MLDGGVDLNLRSRAELLEILNHSAWVLVKHHTCAAEGGEWLSEQCVAGRLHFGYFFFSFKLRLAVSGLAAFDALDVRLNLVWTQQF